MTLVRNETQRYTTALKRAGQSPIGLLPFDGRRRLGGAIEDDAVDLAAFVGDARGDRGEHIVGTRDQSAVMASSELTGRRTIGEP